jgi:hypothetical protein
MWEGLLSDGRRTALPELLSTSLDLPKRHLNGLDVPPCSTFRLFDFKGVPIRLSGRLWPWIYGLHYADL